MLLIAIVLGTTWLQLPLDSPSTFTRGGLIFISLLVHLTFMSMASFSNMLTILGCLMRFKHLENSQELWSGEPW